MSIVVPPPVSEASLPGRPVIYAFGDYELDTRRFELRHRGDPQPVEPQVFDVLALLLGERDRVVGKDELLEEVWGERLVAEATLTSRIKAARRAVGDDGRAQRVIKTYYGRGYRFVAEVEEQDHQEAGSQRAVEAAPAVPPVKHPPGVGGGLCVGRNRELERLRRVLSATLEGRRRTVLVSGEAGVGKSTLVAAFAEEAAAAGLRVARGQCLQHQGTGEAYMPVLEALGRLAGEGDGDTLIGLLARRAPSWLLQMPWLVPEERLETLRERTLGTTRERMLREVVETLEELSRSTPLLLILEDLHWSDPSTVDLFSLLARRQDPAHLFVVGTFRTAENRGPEDSLTPLRALPARGLAEELHLEPLAPPAVAEYLACRLPGAAVAEEVAALLHRRTEGHPLFMDTLLAAWKERGLVAWSEEGWEVSGDLDALSAGIPDTLRLLLEEALQRLEPEDREALEAASVVGPEFSAAAVAAALDQDPDQVEDRLARRARRQQLIRPRERVEWPDGTVSSGFSFLHQLHQEALYDRVPAGRRMRLHRRIGGRIEAAYGLRAEERGPELAVHFQRGRDTERAVRYLHAAARQAMRREASQEAIAHLRNGLRELEGWAEGRQRDAIELRLQTSLAPLLVAQHGWSADEASSAFERARELGDRLDDPVARSRILFGLASLHEFKGEFRRSQRLMEERLELEGGGGTPGHLLESHDLLACSQFHQGAFATALRIADASPGLGGVDDRFEEMAAFGEHPLVGSHTWAALALWFLGHPDKAKERVERAIALAREPGRIHSLAAALSQAAMIHYLRREPERVEELAGQTLDLARRQGFSYRVALSRIFRGWSWAAAEEVERGLAEVSAGIAEHDATGAAMDRPFYLAILAEVELRAEQAEAARDSLEEALEQVRRSRSFFYEAELHRQLGDVAATLGDEAGADAAYRKALTVAREQGSRSLELRAAVSLADRGDEEARTTVAALESWLASPRETPDLGAVAAPAAEETSTTVPEPTLPLKGWERVQEVFRGARCRLTAEREEYLRRACGDDTGLRDEVERLLREEEENSAAREASAAAGLQAALGDRYALEEVIGSGGAATVFRALDRRHQRPVAVKVMRPEVSALVNAERFLQEIRVTARLQHPHVLPLHDSGRAGHLLYYVMPFVPGGSLRGLLQREGRLTVERTLALLEPVARALGEAHRQGIVHRDVKPENILLVGEEAVVADFGVARVAAGEDAPGITGAGFRLGTPSYMSPEQALGAVEIDARTDVYALACVVWECLAGAPPFGGSSTDEVLSGHISARVPSLRAVREDLPEAVDRALARGLAKEPGDRHASTSELMAALREGTS